VTDDFVGIALVTCFDADVRVWKAVFGLGGYGLVGSFWEAFDFDE